MLPLRAKTKSKSQVAQTKTIPAPTSGWYVGDNQATPPPKTAVILNNAFPQLDYVRPRGGSQVSVTGLPGTVTTLMAWTTGVTSRLFAVCTGKIYDVSGTGAVGAPVVTGLGSSSVISTQFAGFGGTYLVAVTGSDPVQIFDGASWGTTPAVTGYAGTGFSYVWQHKGRLYFVDGKSRDVYYLGLAALGGPATPYPLSAFFQYGGYIIAGGTWTIDSTSGVFETWIAVSSEGEILMFVGSYPGGTDWEMRGRYKVSRPLGPNCLLRTGGDLAIMTEDGIVAVSQIEALDQVALQNVAVTKPIAPAWRNAVLARKGLTGWQILSWPLQSMVVINLPKTSSSDYTQFVANSRTGAWAQYVGWDANCFAVFNDNLYYGDSQGRVLQAETGGLDAGVTSYTTSIMCGFSDLGGGSALKQVRAVKPYVLTANPTVPQVTVAVDYNLSLPTAPSISAKVGGALWDVALWDVDVWGGDLISENAWLDVQGIGSAIAVTYQITLGVASVTPDIRISQFDVLYEAGSIGLG